MKPSAISQKTYKPQVYQWKILLQVKWRKYPLNTLLLLIFTSYILSSCVLIRLRITPTFVMTMTKAFYAIYLIADSQSPTEASHRPSKICSGFRRIGGRWDKSQNSGSIESYTELSHDDALRGRKQHCSFATTQDTHESSKKYHDHYRTRTRRCYSKVGSWLGYSPQVQGLSTCLETRIRLLIYTIFQTEWDLEVLTEKTNEVYKSFSKKKKNSSWKNVFVQWTHIDRNISGYFWPPKYQV